VRIALSRIQSGQSDICLVGGAYNGERKDMLLLFGAGGFIMKGPFAPVWERASHGGGMALGSLGAFLVLESREHATARNAKPLARLLSVQSDRTNRQPGAVAASLARMWKTISSRLVSGRVAVISGATGADPATAEERAWLATVPDVPVRATGTHVGHGLEPQFVMNIALATVALGHEKLFAPASSSGPEKAMESPLAQLVVTGVGHWRGEGMALVEVAQ
jgi:3-oxoacyl-[acyl-carrier-protein] synthase II